jgi:hypothetical protein
MLTKVQRQRQAQTSAVRQLLDQYKIVEPKQWHRLSRTSKLDFIATRILANSRTTTSHTAMREEGILSVSQYERRLNREVYSSRGSLEEVPPDRGVFGRQHIKRTR